MVDLSRTHKEPKEQLFEELARVTAGMLGVMGSDMHMQPMAQQVDAETSRLIFFASQKTDLAAAVGDGKRAHFCLVGKDHDYHACLAGTLTQSHDRTLIDKHWGPMISAWFPEGKEDPNLILLVLTLSDAAIWASTDSSIRFGWEMAKALTTDTTPDVGVHTTVNF